jgi:hypothetical protein
MGHCWATRVAIHKHTATREARSEKEVRIIWIDQEGAGLAGTICADAEIRDIFFTVRRDGHTDELVRHPWQIIDREAICSVDSSVYIAGCEL